MGGGGGANRGRGGGGGGAVGGAGGKHSTLTVGLVGVIAAVVGAVADPRRVDAQRGGVAADEAPLFHTQLVEVRAVCVV